MEAQKKMYLKIIQNKVAMFFLSLVKLDFNKHFGGYV